MECAVNTRTLSWVEKSLAESGQLRRAELFGRDGDAWLGATIDSRGDCVGRLFFALAGETTDGHRFALDAASNGSCAIVIDRDDIAERAAEAGTAFFLVTNVLVGLQDLSRAFRNSLDIRVVAITGSSGKTTTKEFIRLVLRKKYKVHSNTGNLNNHIGVPLTILDTDLESEYLVSEVGANHLGEVGFLADILRPDVGVITNIGDAHIGLFGSRDKIAEAKAELLPRIDEGGYAVLPEDDAYIAMLEDAARCRVVKFGLGESSDFKVSEIEERGEHIEFRVNDVMLTIHTVGTYNALNAAAAFAVGDVCGVAAEQSREALSEAESLHGRARIYHLGSILLIDDSYNANPTSMRAAIDSLKRRDAARRVAILGDMAELGSYNDGEHEKLGRYLASSGIDVLYYLGPSGSHVASGAGEGYADRIHIFDTIDDMCDAVEQGLADGDAVLVKASRAASLDKVVARLRRTLKKEKNA